MSSARPPTPEQVEAILHAIEFAGASLTGAAESIGRSREWLRLAQVADPDLRERIVTARGRLEVRYSTDIESAMQAGDAALVAVLIKRRSNRFPQRHSDDPRMRHAMEIAGDEHPEDLASARAQTVEADAAIVIRLADRILREDEG